MKTIGTDLKAHLAQEVTTVAHCLQLTRKDTTIMGFTDHDQDIIYSGVTYEAATGVNLSNISGANNLSAGTVDIISYLNSNKISDDDLKAGVYDNAEIRIFLINYKVPAQGILALFRGWLGEVTCEDNTFKTEIRSLASALQQNIGQLYSPMCRADFGDAKCGLNLATYTFSGTVVSVVSNQEFTCGLGQATAYFDGGKLTWLTGANAGRAIEVKRWTLGTTDFIITHPMPENIVIGDTFQVSAGCDKLLDTCHTDFNNVVNFRGEPYLPGLSKLLQYPNAHS